MFRHYSGVDEAMVELEPDATVTDLLYALAARFDNPVFSENAPLVMIMVNQKNASRKTILKEGDIVRLLPILGGG